MVQISKSLDKKPWFHNLILGVIVFNAVLLGAETNPSLTNRHPNFFSFFNTLIQIIFLLEISIRVLSHWPKPWHFFRNGWNNFDFLVVAMSMLPVAGPFANVARLARVLRVTRLVSLSEDLKLIIGTMLKSLPSMGHVGLLLGVLLYVYGVLGYHLFSVADPAHWSTLPSALLSLFKVLTLEGWIEMHNAVAPTQSWAWLYFMSFIVVAVFVVVNLFIAVVINNLETVKKENSYSGLKESQKDVMTHLSELKEKISEMEQTLLRGKK